MTALPQQDNLVVPIEWQGETHKTTMQAAAYELSGTIGWRPYTEYATLSFVLDKSAALTLLDDFKATSWNGVYDYTCLVRGAVRVRLTGDYTFEEKRGTQKVIVSVGVKTV